MGAAASSRAVSTVSNEYDVWSGLAAAEVERRLAERDGEAVCADASLDEGEVVCDGTGLFVKAAADADCLRLGSRVPRIVALTLTETVGAAVNAGDASPAPTSLRSLSLAGVAWRTPTWLAGCPRLMRLDVSGCGGLDLGALVCALAAPLALKSLDAGRCGLAAAGLAGLKACARLTALRLPGNAFAADDGPAVLEAVAAAADALVELDLSGSPLAEGAPGEQRAHREACLTALPRLACLDGEALVAEAPGPSCPP